MGESPLVVRMSVKRRIFVSDAKLLTINPMVMEPAVGNPCWSFPPPWSNQTTAMPSIFGMTMDFDSKGMAHSPRPRSPLVCCSTFNPARDLVELVELFLRRVPLHDLLPPLSMTSTTASPSLSALARSVLQRPVFSRQEKSPLPSSGCSNVGLSSGTDSTVSEEDENEDTIVRWGWVWYKGEMRRISELPPAPLEPPKPSPPKRKVGSTHYFGR